MPGTGPSKRQASFPTTQNIPCLMIRTWLQTEKKRKKTEISFCLNLFCFYASGVNYQPDDDKHCFFFGVFRSTCAGEMSHCPAFIGLTGCLWRQKNALPKTQPRGERVLLSVRGKKCLVLDIASYFGPSPTSEGFVVLLCVLTYPVFIFLLISMSILKMILNAVFKTFNIL